MNNIKKKNLKFIALYISFSEQEKEEFRNFLKANNLGTSRNYVEILDSVKSDEKGEIVIKGSKSSITRWNRFSELQHLAEIFIIQKTINTKNLLSRYILMKEYDKRGINSSFKKVYKNLQKEISGKSLNKYDQELNRLIESLYLEHMKKISTAKQFAENLEKFNKSRLEILIIDQLEFLIEMWIQSTVKEINVDTFAIDIFEAFDFNNVISILSKSVDSKSDKRPAIRFLYYLYLSINDLRDNLNYKKAQKIFFSDLKFISRGKRDNYFSYLIFFGIEKKNIAVPESGENLFYIINEKLKEGFTEDLINKDISLSNFRNYILIAINLKKYKWVNDFINKYGPLLKPDIRDDFMNLGKAILMFEKKDFKNSQKLLMQVKKKNPFNFVDVSILMLKVFFELNNPEDCHDELRKFNEYLRKDRNVKDLLIVNAKNFCKGYTMLLKVKQNPTKKYIIELQFFLSKNLLIGKKWIEKKLNEIISGIN
jgi:hypothetical protein